MEDTQVVDTTVVDTATNEGMGGGTFGGEIAAVSKPEAPKVSPAQDLRDLQNLIVLGIYPGNVAPQVVKAYQLLEVMAKAVETEYAETHKA